MLYLEHQSFSRVMFLKSLKHIYFLKKLIDF